MHFMRADVVDGQVSASTDDAICMTGARWRHILLLKSTSTDRELLLNVIIMDVSGPKLSGKSRYSLNIKSNVHYVSLKVSI
jgi:hypothetical protein